MAVFRVQVFYKFGTLGKWSNVWHAESADIPTLLTDVSAVMVPDLQPLLHPSATLLRTLISDLAGDTFVSTEQNVGGSSADSASILPLYNSLKAFLNSDELGRPDLKYFKGFLTEAMQTDGELEPTVRSAADVRVTTLLSDMAAAGSPLVTLSGSEYVSASIQSAVQMRQMHRKRKRTTP